MRKPAERVETFKERRKKLGDLIKGSALIVASHPEMIRNDDVHYPYRQDSNLYYLTGFEEPESILLFRPGSTPETVLFVRKKDLERETWDGFRFGPDLTETEFQVDKAYLIDDFTKVAPTLLKDINNLYYRMFKNPWSDDLVQQTLETLRISQGRTGQGYMSIHDSQLLLGEMRLSKSEYELTLLREACEISAQGHIAAMKFTRPGVNERQIQGVITHAFLMKGAAREGYNYIVASGASSTTLHYNFNDQPCKDGDLLLIDAGAEYNYFTGDITRTFPVNGKFTEEQALVYQSVLTVQKRIIEMIKPGLQFKLLQETTINMLVDSLLTLGLLSGRKEDIVTSQAYKRFYPHGVSHWLGMDVHDSGLYVKNNESRPLEANMCFTVEPGLYIRADDETVPKKFRGIGVRIEDNIRVTSTGCEVMTSSAPKEISDLEKIVGSQ
jgi:Xaa-Pro aminopeptidase